MAVVDPVLGGVGLLYLVINVAYSLGVKRIVLLDVFSVAGGYVIRATAGAVWHQTPPICRAQPPLVRMPAIAPVH